jgi:hypothetical protein
MATRKSTSKTVTKPAAAKPPAAKPARPATSAAAEVPKATTKTRPTRVPQAPTPAEPPSPVATPVGGDRYRWIAHAAYLKAERRGFVPGREVEDWLEAESEFLGAFGLKPS